MLLKSRWLESDLRLEPRYGSDFCRVIVYTSYLDDEKKQVSERTISDVDMCILRQSYTIYIHLNVLKNSQLVVCQMRQSILK